MASDAPTPHSPPMPMPKKRAQDQEHGEIGREPAEHFDDGEIDDVRHQGNAATVAVGEQSEEQRADRAQGEGGGEREDDLFFADAEARGQGIHKKHDDEEVECVEGPAEKARGDGVGALRARQWDGRGGFRRILIR